MPGANFEKRRPPQNPRDGKHELRYSDKVRSATDSVKSADVQSFDRGGVAGSTHGHAEAAINPVQVISNFARLGESLRDASNFRKIASEIAAIAEMAEGTVVQEAGDWFDGHTIKRNMSELKKHAGAFSKLAEELDNMHQRATALYDDMGNVLARYFEMGTGPDGQEFDGNAPPTLDSDPDSPVADKGTAPPAGIKPAASASPAAAPSPTPDTNLGTDPTNVGEPEDDDDDVVEAVTNAVMERILPERGEETPQAARKSLRTPKSFARPHQHMSHDQAKELLRKTGATTVEDAHRVMEAAGSVKLKKKEEAIRNVVKRSTAAKIEGVLLDLFTAGGMVQILDNLSPPNKKKFLEMPITKMASITFKLLR